MNVYPLRSSFKKQKISSIAAAALSVALVNNVNAEQTNAPSGANTQSTNAPALEVQQEKPAPLPLHQIEGNGGIFSTLSAYIVNPPRNGELVGRPSAGFSYVNVGHGANLESFTVTESPWKRLELGYGYEILQTGDLSQAIQNATTIKIRDDEVHVHNFNARVNLVAEGEYDQKWLPAITLGTHYKYNDTVNRIDDDLKGTLTSIGIVDNQGVDFTLYGSKMITALPRPVLVELGGRATKAAHLGLFGFTDDYNFLFEGNVVVFVTDKLALAAEYKQKPNEYQSIGSLIHPEDDWWTLDAAYVVNKHMTVAAGYGHFGGVLNHEANGAWGLTTKWEF